MSDSSSGDLRETASTDGPGILAGLPRTRPQRPSARRAASRVAKPSARSASSSRQAGAAMPGALEERVTTKARASGKARAKEAKPKEAKRAPAKIRATATGKTRAAAPRGASVEERAPRQGFEAEPDSLGPVQPPGSTELVSSAAELAGELAKAGVSTGARVLRDFLSRLPG